MNTNPFESPREVKSPTGKKTGGAPKTAERSLASKRYKLTILILSVPALVNLLQLNSFLLNDVFVQPDRGLVSLYIFAVKATGIGFDTLATFNAIGVVVVIFGLLFGGFYWLEENTRRTNLAFHREPQLGRWYEALYVVLGQAYFLAVPAAVLWTISSWLVYGTEIRSTLFEAPFSILAGLTMWSLFGSLYWRWYKISK